MLVDTSYWVEYFNRPGSGEAGVVRNLIRDDRATLAGVILAELLQGARTQEELSELRSALGAVDLVETTGEVYARAGRLGFDLRRLGVKVPITDCVIGAAAESIGGLVLTLDRHFEELVRVASLELVRF